MSILRRSTITAPVRVAIAALQNSPILRDIASQIAPVAGVERSTELRDRHYGLPTFCRTTLRSPSIVPPLLWIAEAKSERWVVRRLIPSTIRSVIRVVPD